MDDDKPTSARSEMPLSKEAQAMAEMSRALEEMSSAMAKLESRLKALERDVWKDDEEPY